jgi:complex iron-sulfur molybdoenzyme family reductase subunit gamma
LINFILSLSTPEARARAGHRRVEVVARQVPAKLSDPVPEEVWSATKPVGVLVSPLWWRNHDDPDLQVRAIHDGQTLAVRLTWKDTTANEQAGRTEDFEDMAALQLFRGAAEPFLGMGSETGRVDLWQWRAGWQRPDKGDTASLDDYPFDSPLYAGLTKGSKGLPDLLTARAAGNPHAQREPGSTAGSLAAQGVGSVTFRPKASQVVTARSAWHNGGWTVVLRRPLQVEPADGVPLAPGQRCSVALALWDGEARDRNGQKLVSIWHDLRVE